MNKYSSNKVISNIMLGICILMFAVIAAMAASAVPPHVEWMAQLKIMGAEKTIPVESFNWGLAILVWAVVFLVELASAFVFSLTVYQKLGFCREKSMG